MTDEQADHIQTRTKRLGLAEVDIEPEWATEALWIFIDWLDQQAPENLSKLLGTRHHAERF